MSERHYSDYIEVKNDYRPNMTREAIDETPDTWLGFFPHKKFVEFLQTLLSSFETGEKSTWLTGNYGTGKSNAALVVQKLFMDDESRVRSWFKDRSKYFSDVSTLQKKLFARRGKTLVVYDYNASGLGADQDFLVRLEKGVASTLNFYGLLVPDRGNLDKTIEWLRRLGKDFIQTRDSMTEKLTEVFCSYRNVEEIITSLQNGQSSEDVTGGILAEVQQVLRRMDVFTGVNVPTFRLWIKKILELNKLENVVYIFDEFSEFIEAHKTQLKTFEEVTESPNINRFFLVPVTHLSLNAFLSDKSADAKRAKDRFEIRKLEMPTEVAFQLAADAFKEREEFREEWEIERNKLSSSIIGVVDRCKEDGVSRELFYDLLPIHPLSAFFLKFLSESARSNQRSLFEYLKGNAQGREFQEFIATGGPAVSSRQFLTVDYLWKYFVERDGELGLSADITSINLEFNRLRNAEFPNRADDDVELRVLKAAFLFILLGRLNPGGHKLLQPTVSNVCLAFQGDGSVVNVEHIVRNLANNYHCFTIVGADDRIELFASSVGLVELKEKCQELEKNFHELLHEKVAKKLEEYIGVYKPGYSKRFVLRASDHKNTTWGNMTSATREKFGTGTDSDGTISLWFVFAKNHEEELAIPSRIENFLKQSKDDFRTLFFTFKDRSLCEDDAQLWYKYCLQLAQFQLSDDSGMKDVSKKEYEKIEDVWLKKIKDPATIVTVYCYENGKIVSQDLHWSALYKYLETYVCRTLPNCVDRFAGKLNTAFGETGYKGWAVAGIKFEGKLAQKQLVDYFKLQGIDAEGTALAPEHPLIKLRTFFENKFRNSVDRGGNFSLRKAYLELRRAPYGFKPCAVTAFCLGYALKWTLTKGYLWDNGQLPGELNEETLAEIIDSVVKEDGNDKSKNEKLICRLSKEDKIFVKKAPKIFGADECAKIEDATRVIQAQISDVSGSIPLWILARYVGKHDQEHGAKIQEIFETVCQICQISSKKKTASEERSGYVRKIGETLSKEPILVEAAASYVKYENFALAFKEFIDSLEPRLCELASKALDASEQYCKSVLKKIPEEGGVLWNERDVSAEIDATFDEYRVIFAAKSILGFQAFTPYSAVVEQLKNRVLYVKVPICMITTTYPNLTDFLSCLFPANGKIQRSAGDLASTLEQYSDVVCTLFAEAGRKATLDILRSHVGNEKIADDVLFALANEVVITRSTTESEFLDDLRKKLEANEKKSVVANLKNEWFRISGVKSPGEWAKKFRIPPRYAFDDVTIGEDYSRALVSPEKYSSSNLESMLEKFREMETINVDVCQKRFLDRVVPSNCAGFGITFGTLANFLCREYDDNPCFWSTLPNIDKFIKEQYLTEFAPKIAQKIEETDPDDLKKQVLALVKENQNVGMYFWQDK